MTAARGQIIETQNRPSVGGHTDKHLPSIVWSSDPGEKFSRAQIRTELPTIKVQRPSGFILVLGGSVGLHKWQEAQADHQPGSSAWKSIELRWTEMETLETLEKVGDNLI